MKIFISMRDLNQLDRQDPAHAVVRKKLHRMAELYPENGYLILVEKTDMGKPLVLPELTLDLPRTIWEGVSRIDNFYYAVLLRGNEFALEFLIENAGWLDDDLRKGLEAHTAH